MNWGTLHSVRVLGLFVDRLACLRLSMCVTGGSTIVVLFEKGMVQWDEDLVINGRASLETLVRVGMGIGRCPSRPGSRIAMNGSHPRS